jgi:hypothetical protein
LYEWLEEYCSDSILLTVLKNNKEINKSPDGKKIKIGIKERHSMG